MGNNTSALQTFEKIQKLINSSRFNEAFRLLTIQMKRYPNLQKDLEALLSLESTYRYMLDYLSTGNNDPSLKEVVEQIRDGLHSANDLTLRETKLTDSSDIYSSTRRLEALRNSSFLNKFVVFEKAFLNDNENYKDTLDTDSLKISVEQAAALDELFNYVWTMKGAPQEEYEEISKALDNPQWPDYFKALMLSALILGNISYFDSNSFDILLNQYETATSPSVKARAIIGVLLISLLYPSRVSGNLKLRTRLILAADDDLKKLANDVLLSIIRTYDTKRIDNKMRNEVIPGLMKIQPQILDKMRNLSSDSEDFLSDMNPNWEEMLENSELGEKLQEINDMQLDGADVMVTAFSNLKNFPFFKKISNWFIPFVPGNYEFDSLPIHKDSHTASRLTAIMCESDLHSFLLSLSAMPETNRNQMLSNIESQMKEAQEAMSDAIGETYEKVLAKKIRQALQDIYRFFKFYSRKDDFRDPFGQPFLATHIKPLMPLLGIDLDNVKIVSDFYFKNKYFEEAAELFEMINSEKSDPQLWEKIGFSYDRLRNYPKAIEWYKKSELINPENPWLIKQLAIALKNAGKTTEALEYYDRALENEPENFHLLLSAGQCSLEAGKPTEALQHFYHAQYLKPEKIGVQRAIAWAELMANNFDKARSQYEKVMAHSKADKTDFLNAAHCELAMGNFSKALSLYKKFVEANPEKDITPLLLAFKEDTLALKQLNIKTSDLRLIVDKIRYDLSE
ncbi:MAG: tetratricopeptide repeat protein [Muribaculaceae bacterium]|nr:tetratricopeptide repeat protein [Muribaculaceae bacterium]